MRYVIWLVSVLLLAACGSLSGDNVGATLEAGDRQVATEAASIGRTIVAFGTESAVTVEHLVADYDRRSSINEQLFATLAAGSTPTVVRAAGRADPPPGTAAAFLDNQRWFTKTGISRSVDGATGCVLNPTDTFNRQEIDTLYVTFFALNVEAGTVLRAEWFHEGNLVTADDWRLERFSSEACYWFSIDRSDTDFAPGNWTVQLYADSFPLEAPLAFIING